MLERCFLHLPGVGPGFAQALRDAGIHDWYAALRLPLPCGAVRAERLKAGVEESLLRLASRDAAWFGKALSPAEQWRLFPCFQDEAAYVDIETTGLSRSGDVITTIALFDGASVRTYVRGVNLSDFADAVAPYRLLVTWNGRSFDAPVLRRELDIALDKGNMAHLDLLPVFRALGLRGGLKRVERLLGIDREELEGLDGWDAVRLWRAYECDGDPRVLETLLAYNVADVLSLESLAAYASARYRAAEEGRDTGNLCVDPLKKQYNPFIPDRRVVQRVLGVLPGGGTG
jgi:uncharacterized protein YprB with RNaseH-like and TPR domain